MGAGLVGVTGLNAGVDAVTKSSADKTGALIFDIVWQEVRAVFAPFISVAALFSHKITSQRLYTTNFERSKNIRNMNKKIPPAGGFRLQRCKRNQKIAGGGHGQFHCPIRTAPGPPFTGNALLFDRYSRPARAK